MPIAGMTGRRLHYQIEGDGPPLLLHHGFANAGEDWRDFGILAHLAPHFRCILIDALGHGASDKPGDPAAYAPEARAAAVTALLDAIGLDRVHYYGHSYGGQFGYALAAHAPHRLRSLVISGAHPFPASMQGWRDLAALGKDAFLARCDAMYGSWMTPARRARLAANDLATLAIASPDRPLLTQGLAGLPVPALFVAGEADPLFTPAQAKSVAAMTPGAQVRIYPAFSHVDIFGRPETVQPDIIAFLADIA